MSAEVYCGICPPPFVVQGGEEGLTEHRRVVHGSGRPALHLATETNPRPTVPATEQEGR